MDKLIERLKLALDAVGMVIWDSTIVDGRIDKGEINWSPEGAVLVGIGTRAINQPFRQFLEMVVPGDRERIVAVMQAGIERRDQYDVQYQLLSGRGELLWLEAKARIVCDAGGKPVRTLGMLWDATEKITHETEAANRDRMAEVTLRAIGDAVIRADREGNVTFMNRAAETLTAWPATAAMGQPVDAVMPLESDGKPMTEHVVRKCLRMRQTIGVSKHAQLVNRNGRRIDVEDAAAPIWSGDGALIGVVLVTRDVSYERRMALQISWQAKHDALTGLINRAEFEVQLNAALLRSKEEGQVHAILYMDLDRFKIVNDMCGHAAGDLLLQNLCKLLHTEMREADILARLGGDELGALLLNCPLDRACHIAEHLRGTVRQFRFPWNERSFDVGVSIGVVEVNAESISATELMLAADQACYLAKEQGRDRVHVYRESDVMLAQKRGELQWFTRLREAIDNRHFRLFSMPIVSLLDADDHHDEILLRMATPTGQLVLPGAFIPAAERYDIMQQVDRWVIHALCAHLYQTREATVDSGTGTRFSVNLSGPTLGTPGFSDYVVEQFRNHRIAPERICFEITETAVISNLQGAHEFMARLHALGCKFSLDDFGSGLSSFGYLRSLPVDFLKIDGVFVRDITTNPVNQALVRAINEVGHVMNIKTVAEYVENVETLALVRSMGVDYAQGHAVGEARSLEVAGAG
jgi:diguanylate cyclase (GGDEF)-like protein/PAS domain S-box-containing protein